MIVYDGTKNDFLKSVESDAIAIEIENSILEKLHKHTPKNEFRSWENSLEYMYKVMNDHEIPEDAGVAIEYNIPHTSKRVDFIVTGYDEKGKPQVVIIELKQWDQLNAIDGQDALVETRINKGIHRVVHPSYQAWSYAQVIRDYNSTAQELNIGLNPCACLHNYVRHENDPLDSSIYKEYTEAAPAFTRGQVQDLRSFIKKFVRKGDQEKVLYLIENGKIRPSKSLQNAIASMLKGNTEFFMLDEQKVVYEDILQLSEQSFRDFKKRTVIVKGGPGTGKSVVAINLLSELTQRDQLVHYCSKNGAPRAVYKAKLKDSYKMNAIDNMFKGSASYTNQEANSIHTILADEAHRLEERSQYTPKTGNENQIKEIINAAFCSVFFIDESQRVTISDIGSIEEIKKWANEQGSIVFEMELVSQFRCNGSDGYLAWLDNVLEIRETANYNLDGIDFDFKVVDDPSALRKMIVEKNNDNHCSRILAGYCWNWNKAEVDNTDYHDIVIGDFEMSWNLQNKEPFAVSETSINEVGCIHTSQGLEFDYVGVIIGDDLRYENGHIVTDFTKRASTDQSLKGIKKMAVEDPEKANKVADEIIKNTYRTLLTRGMKGCYVYCTDENLANYFKTKLK